MRREAGVFEYANAEKEIKRCRSSFESTGIKEVDGKVIWRKISKDGSMTNTFAVQFRPDVPWAAGKWFIQINGYEVLNQHPELFVETKKYKEIGHDEYFKMLKEKTYASQL